MKIGVKFCGGCQTRFDRIKVFNEIVDTYGEDVFVYTHTNTKDRYDGLIVIYGCPVQCPNISHIQTMHPPLFIGPENYQKAIAMLAPYLESLQAPHREAVGAPFEACVSKP